MAEYQGEAQETVDEVIRGRLLSPAGTTRFAVLFSLQLMITIRLLLLVCLAAAAAAQTSVTIKPGAQ